MGQEIKRFKAVIKGSRVQGVGLRVFTKENAEKLGLTGWVKNMADGSVSAEIQGTQTKINALVDLIKKGNFVIKADTVDLEEIPTVADEPAFIIRY